MRYALLVSPSSNRVYAQSAPALALAELGVVAERIAPGGITDARIEQLGSVDYVSFDAEALAPRALEWLSNLAATF
ncbi:MAG TPA: hypothetical protein VIW29_12575, partial [Polyangiaceae bacterium]